MSYKPIPSLNIDDATFSGEVTSIDTLRIQESDGVDSVEITHDGTYGSLSINSSPCLRFHPNTKNLILYGDLQSIYSNGAKDITGFRDIYLTGSAGIGINSPTSKLHIEGAGDTDATSALNVTDSVQNSLLYVRDDGNVGIGTSSPNYKLQVYSADADGDGYAVSTTSGGETAFLSPRRLNFSTGNSPSIAGVGLNFILGGGSSYNSGDAFTFRSNDARQNLGDTDAEQAWINIKPSIEQTSTANYVGLLMDVTETSIGSSQNYLADFRVGGDSKFNVTREGNVSASGFKIEGQSGFLKANGTVDNATFTVSETGAVLKAIDTPVQIFNPWASQKFYDGIYTNRYHGNAHKLKITVDSVDLSLSDRRKLTSANYDSGARIILSSAGGPASVISVNHVDNGLTTSNGFSYANGQFHVMFYYGKGPETLTARVKNRDGVWTDMTMVGYKTGGNVISWRGSVPIGNYITDVEFTATPSATADVWLTEIEYHASRMGLNESGVLSKHNSKLDLVVDPEINFYSTYESVDNYSKASLSHDTSGNLTIATEAGASGGNAGDVIVDAPLKASTLEISGTTELASSGADTFISGNTYFGGTSRIRMGTGSTRTNIVPVETNAIRLDGSSVGDNSGSIYLANLTASGEVEITDATKGVILKSPNGTRYRITVADDGTLSTAAV